MDICSLMFNPLKGTVGVGRAIIYFSTFQRLLYLSVHSLKLSVL